MSVQRLAADIVLYHRTSYLCPPESSSPLNPGVFPLEVEESRDGDDALAADDGDVAQVPSHADVGASVTQRGEILRENIKGRIKDKRTTK